MFERFKKRIVKKLYAGLYPPGHFYHPVPHINEIENFKADDPLWNIELREQCQTELLQRFVPYVKEFVFPEHVSQQYRYFKQNSFFNITDGMILFFILRHFNPKRIIEVGSGFSSALMLDTSDTYFKESPIQFTFIEPYPERLQSLLKPHEEVEIVVDKVQSVPVKKFKELKKNDILFVDSSHVSKYGSDVNHIIFNILPQLNEGVILHFHDICYPFEYPKEWLQNGIYWNEAYLLRAFLMGNSAYQVLLFNHFLSTKHLERVQSIVPEFKSGGSLWLQKVNATAG